MSTTASTHVSTPYLTLRQVRYENKSFWRNPAAAFFTFAFPLLFLVLFNLLFGNGHLHVDGHTARLSTFYVPSIAAFSVVTGSFTNLAMQVTFAREQGVLKRKRGTPMPALAYLGAKILHSTAVSFLLVAIITLAGGLFYHAHLTAHALPGFFATLIVGTLCFCAMGLAITAVIPNADAAPAVVNAIVLPLLFISDIFINTSGAPVWLQDVAKVFPIFHIAQALEHSFVPFLPHSAWDLPIVLLWGAAGLFVAARYFRWEPKR